MGNQPSTSPVQPAPPTSICDAACQKKRQLEGLKTTMEEKEKTQNIDPEGYLSAKIAYYTALNGPAWVTKEKDRIVREEIQPVITAYSNQYKELTQRQKEQKDAEDIALSMKAEEQMNEEDLKFFKKKYTQEQDAVDVSNRLFYLNQLTGSAPSSSKSYTAYFYEVIIVILGIVFIFMLYTKFGAIKSYFSSSSVPVGGKRLPL